MDGVSVVSQLRLFMEVLIMEAAAPLYTLQHWTRGLLTLTSVGTWYWYTVHYTLYTYTLYTLYTSLVPSPPKTTPHCPHAAPWPPQQRALLRHSRTLQPSPVSTHFTLYQRRSYAGTGPTVDCHCAGTSAL